MSHEALSGHTRNIPSFLPSFLPSIPIDSGALQGIAPLVAAVHPTAPDPCSPHPAHGHRRGGPSHRPPLRRHRAPLPHARQRHHHSRRHARRLRPDHRRACRRLCRRVRRPAKPHQDQVPAVRSAARQPAHTSATTGITYTPHDTHVNHLGVIVGCGSGAVAARQHKVDSRIGLIGKAVLQWSKHNVSFFGRAYVGKQSLQSQLVHLTMLLGVLCLCSIVHVFAVS